MKLLAIGSFKNRLVSTINHMKYTIFLLFFLLGCNTDGSMDSSSSTASSSPSKPDTTSVTVNNDLGGTWQLTVYYNTNHTICESWNQYLTVDTTGNVSISGQTWEHISHFSVSNSGLVQFTEALSTVSGSSNVHYTGNLSGPVGVRNRASGTHDYFGSGNLMDWTWEKISPVANG